jgi:hypothetical protein
MGRIIGIMRHPPRIIIMEDIGIIIITEEAMDIIIGVVTHSWVP